MSIEATDAESAAVAKNQSGRVSLADIEAAIGSIYHVNGAEAAATSGTALADATTPLSVLSLCFIVMRNGFTVVGKSAPADPANFNADYGRKLAYEDAVRQLWPLMGFAKRNELSAQS